MFFSSLAKRDRIPELMDDPGLDPEEHRRALAGLARLNAWSDSVGVLWKPIRAMNRPLRVLDVATGSGDVPRGLVKRANAAGVPLQVAGCDISPTAIAAAEQAAPEIHFFVHDAIRDPLPTGFDVVTCSLFLHHLDDDSAIILLKRMAEAAGECVLVNDLARSRFNFLSVWFACHVLTQSRVVHFDGPASVRSAYSPVEAMALAERAGLNDAQVSTRFPCRYLLQWRKHA